MKSKYNRIIYAADSSNLCTTVEIIKEIAPLIGVVKITSNLVMAGHTAIIAKLAQEMHLGFFLDMKLHDVPNTVSLAVQEACKIGATMLTMHIDGGSQMLRAAVEARNTINRDITTVLLGVTMLTSISSSVQTVVEKAKIAKQSGLNGVICSAHEAKGVREALGNDFLIVTPGIRLNADSRDDHVRSATPYEAIENGADYIVIGRPITNAKDRQKLLRQIVQ